VPGTIKPPFEPTTTAPEKMAEPFLKQPFRKPGKLFFSFF